MKIEIPEKYINVISEVITELQRAEAKHPFWPKDHIHAAAIITEELGELTQACLQAKYENGDPINIKIEAIQVGAMAIRFIYNFNKI